MSNFSNFISLAVRECVCVTCLSPVPRRLPDLRNAETSSSPEKLDMGLSEGWWEITVPTAAAEGRLETSSSSSPPPPPSPNYNN